MTRIIWIFHFLVIVFLTIESRGNEIWKEQFAVSDKGFWGDTDGTSVHTDMDGITQWILDVSACQLTAANDYVKTTATSGGRLEAVDCDGEAVWTSGQIPIKNYKNVSVKVNVAETGSGSNISNKYIRVYYQLDAQPETLFETNGENAGDFSSALASQNIPDGENLRIIIRMNSTYASDKLIVNDILVEGDSNVELTATKVSITSCPDFIFTEDKFYIEAQAICSDNTVDLKYNKELYLIDQTGGLNVEKPAQTPINGVYRWENLSYSGEGKLSILIFNNELSSASQEITVEKYYEPTYSFDFEDKQLAGWLSTDDWIISDDGKISGDFSLRHSPDAVNTESVIFYPFDLSLTAADYRWNISMKNGDWDPSSSNRFWYYLVSDSSNPENLNGWAVGVNISGSSDALEIWRFKNGSPDSLIVQSNLTWQANTKYRIEVERREKGQWSMCTRDLLGNRSPFFTGTDFSVFDFTYIGLHFDFTSSRIGQLWADDISLVEFPIPPYLKEITVKDEDELEVIFNKKIDSASVKVQNFQLISESGKYFSVLSAKFLAQTPEKVQLTVERPDEFKLKLLASDIADEDGLVMQADTLEFEWILPCTGHSLVITEIFADPSPTVGLPEYEYIEIYNRSEYPIRLNDIQVQIEAKSYELGENIINPKEYLVLTSSEGASLLPNSLSVKSFPFLRNSKGTIILFYDQTTLIDQIEYSDNWYRDSEKQEGGWSLERIDNDRFCSQDGNWIASKSETGGTPGSENSVARDNQDSQNPEVIELEVISANQLRLTFSENIETEGLENIENYIVEPEIGPPSTIEITNQQEVVLVFLENFVPNKDYVLTVSGISDGCGNTITDSTYKFELQQLKKGDILISEVLFNPYPGGTDFVELYNHSEKTVNLKSLSLAGRDDQFQMEEISSVSSKNRWIQPGEYVLCTKDSLAVALVYYTSCPECFCETSKFPSYPDDQGTVVLLDDSLQVLDEFQYSEKMHHPLIDDREGVSLERLSFEIDAGNAANWHSAASSVGFATPGYANSQHREGLQANTNIVLDPEIFSPNNDGYHDRLLIHYQLEKPGFSANVKVYDSQGRLINHLIKNETLAQTGDWFWDGEKSDNSRSSLGIYIVLVELFDMDGNVKKYRKTCTLTDRL